MEVLLNWEDQGGQTRAHGARVSDAMSQADLTQLYGLADACTVAGLVDAARIDRSITVGDPGGPGPYPAVHQRLHLEFDGLGSTNVGWDVLAPSADCFNLDGSPRLLDGPLFALITWLLIALRTEDDGLVGGVVSATLEESSPTDLLVKAASRLPYAGTFAAEWWKCHGADVTTRGDAG
jgi:hypothetical protein